MKKRDIIEGYIERTDFPNKGVIELPDGGQCIVKNAIPGQKVRCMITKVHKKKCEGRMLDIIEEAADAVSSPCPHFGICGGCTYLTMPYSKELGLKEQQVRGLIKEALGNDYDTNCWEGIKASPVQFGYRNKMEFTFGDEMIGGPLALGMHKRGSFYDIVSVTGCCIVDEDYRKIIRCVLNVFSQDYEDGLITFYHRMKQTGYLRHLMVRKAAHTGEILIDLVTTTQEQHDLKSFTDALTGLQLDGRIVGILHTTNDSCSDAIINEGTTALYGRDYFDEELLNLRFRITPFSFFQTNSFSAEVLYDTVRDYVSGTAGEETTVEEVDRIEKAFSERTEKEAGEAEGKEAVTVEEAFVGKDGTAGENDRFDKKQNASKTEVLYDLYCGTGTIAQLMSTVARKVIGVEIVPEAVDAARINAQMNGIDNCEFIAGDVLKVLDTIMEKPDYIILDPPRDGINPKALRKILDYGVRHIVYVSCKPTSLARDLEAFYNAGYRIVRGCCCDQFPWTSSVETCVLLSHKNS